MLDSCVVGVGGPLWVSGFQHVGLPASVVAQMQWNAGAGDAAIATLRANGLWEIFRAMVRDRSAAAVRDAFAYTVTFERARAADQARGFHTGDLMCPGIDIDKWQAENRAPMYPNQWQTWRLFRTDRDNPDPAFIEQSARAVVSQWFKTVEMGDADHVEILKGPPAGAKRVKRWVELKQPPNVNAKKPIEVWFHFFYRGTRADMPWPVHKAQILNPWCPDKTDWMLAEVWTPPKDKPPPEPSSVPEFIRPDVEKAKEKAKDFWDSLPSGGTWAAALLLFGLAAGGVLAWKASR